MGTTERQPGARASRGTLGLASELTGDLPCVKCRYNLKGLTVKGMCPECGTSVRTTLLAVVDPLARELRPITHPRLTAAGMLAWAVAGFLACVAMWLVQIVSTAGAWALLGENASWWLRWGAVWCVGASGVGALALVRPHGGIPARAQLRALASTLLYIPLVLIVYYLYVRVGYQIGASLPRDEEAARTLIRLAGSACIVGILLGLRPAARMLQARWVLMRIGAVARQTMLAMAAVVGVWTIGDLCVLVSWRMHGGADELVWMAGRFFILVGSLLFTVGMLSIAVDVWRVQGVVAQKPLAVEELFGPGPAAGTREGSA